MKKQLRKLNLMIRFGIIDPTDFYCINVDNYNIRLQGKYSRDIILKMMEWDFRIDEVSKYVEARRKGVNITLTD